MVKVDVHFSTYRKKPRKEKKELNSKVSRSTMVARLTFQNAPKGLNLLSSAKPFAILILYSQFWYQRRVRQSRLRLRISPVRLGKPTVKITDPLCTLFVTFADMDYPNKEVTTKHTFVTKKQRQYPQTRRVVLTRTAKKRGMSYSSTVLDQSEDELDQYERSRISSGGQYTSSSVTSPGLLGSPIVQEVSLSYSAPLTIIPPSKDVPLHVHIESGARSGGEYYDVKKPRHFESVERVNARGRHETEFPVRVTYGGADSVSPPSRHIVPVVNVGHTYRTYDPRSPRGASALSDTIISETTTIEELTTITTTGQRRNNGDGAMSPTSVNALAQQFENTVRREQREAQRARRTPQQESPRARVVVVSKSPSGGNQFYSTDEAKVRRVERAGYSPDQRDGGVVSTTIVDIDPGYRSPRYVEETYQVQEEFRTIKTYTGGQKKAPVAFSPEPTREYIKHYSRSSSPVREPEVEQSRGSTPVRSVVEQFESRIDAETRKPKPYGKTESLDRYAVMQKEVLDKTTKTQHVVSPTPAPRPVEEPVRPVRVAPSPPTAPRQTPVTPPATPLIPKEEPLPISEEKTDTVTSNRHEGRLRVEAWEEITTTRKSHKEEPKPEETVQDTLPPPPPPAPVTPPPVETTSSTTTYTTENRQTTVKEDNETRYEPHLTSVLPPLRDMTTTYKSSISSREGFSRSGNSLPFRSGPMMDTGVSLSAMSPFSQNAASAIRDAREREKKEMSDLNDRLASYIEKVRFLEAQNRKLAHDLELLKSRWGSDSSAIRIMYESELKSARSVIDDSNRQRDQLEQEIRRLMTELTEYRKKYEDAVNSRQLAREEADQLLDKLAKIEAEINLIKRRISYLDEEVKRIKAENNRLMNELSRNRTVIEQESLQRIDFQNQVQTLLEECQYVGRVQGTELGELVSMAHRDTTPENREFFKNELASAIRDIRSEYDQRNAATRNDMESWYKIKVQEIHTQSSRNNMEQTYARDEVKKLRITLSELRSKLTDLEARNSLLERQIQELTYQLEDDQKAYESAINERETQIRKMREECQALMVELQMLLDTKQTLDAEIAIYRKMLEGEENRAGLRQLVEQVVKTTSYDHSTESVRQLRGESSSYSNFQRSAKGNVSIHEVSPDGRFILVENTSRSKEENIGEWKLKRRVDGKKEHVYTFPKEFILKPNRSVKVFARGQGVHSPPDSLVYDGEESWGTGASVQTFLYNVDGEERATHIQRQSHS